MYTLGYAIYYAKCDMFSFVHVSVRTHLIQPTVSLNTFLIATSLPHYDIILSLRNTQYPIPEYPQPPIAIIFNLSYAYML